MVLKRTFCACQWDGKANATTSGVQPWSKAIRWKKKGTCRGVRRMQPQDVGFSLTESRSESGSWERRGDLCIYRCVPPTHEYGTRPFLRYARSQGRSPHASGKAKNTFGPVGIPLFGAPQAPGNNPPRRGYKPGGMAPWGRRNSPVPSICRCLPPDMTWHKVKSPKAD